MLLLTRTHSFHHHRLLPTKLCFKLPARYPDEAPEVTLRKVSGVPQAALLEFLTKRAKSLLGNEMVCVCVRVCARVCMCVRYTCRHTR